MKLAIIAAIARNRVIGKDGKLPWHISEDIKRFKSLTTGHTVLMGRRTYESLGKPLSNRRNIVVTSTAIPGIECYPSIDEALVSVKDQETVFVIGGAQLYSKLLHHADLLYLTFVDRDVTGDTYFPEYEHLLKSRFEEVSREQRDGYAFLDFVRRNSTS